MDHVFQIIRRHVKQRGARPDSIVFRLAGQILKTHALHRESKHLAADSTHFFRGVEGVHLIACLLKGERIPAAAAAGVQKASTGRYILQETLSGRAHIRVESPFYKCFGILIVIADCLIHALNSQLVNPQIFAER